MPGRLRRTLSRFVHETDGAYIIEFAITMPVLILLSLGLLEFSLVSFEFQKASEATRRAARYVIIGNDIPNTANLLDVDSAPVITCTSTGGEVSCDNASPAGTASGGTYPTANENFQAMLALMQAIKTDLEEEMVVVTYESTKVGDVDNAGGVIPLVTITITGLVHTLVTGKMIGVETMDFPDFKTSILGSGRTVNSS